MPIAFNPPPLPNPERAALHTPDAAGNATGGNDAFAAALATAELGPGRTAAVDSPTGATPSAAAADGKSSGAGDDMALDPRLPDDPGAALLGALQALLPAAGPSRDAAPARPHSGTRQERAPVALTNADSTNVAVAPEVLRAGQPGIPTAPTAKAADALATPRLATGVDAASATATATAMTPASATAATAVTTSAEASANAPAKGAPRGAAEVPANSPSPPVGAPATPLDPGLLRDAGAAAARAHDAASNLASPAVTSPTPAREGAPHGRDPLPNAPASTGPATIEAALARLAATPTRPDSKTIDANHASSTAHATGASDVPLLPASDARAPRIIEIAAAVNSPEWRPAVVHEVAQLVMLRQDRAELRLNPADLGPIALHVKVEAGQATLLVTAAQPATRDALELAIPQLRDALAQQGITLGQASVQGDARQPPGEPFAKQADGSTPTVRTLALAGDAPDVARVSRGTIDVYA